MKQTPFVIVAAIGLVMAAETHAQRASLSRRIEYHNPDWSPDGRTLVFESTLDGKYSIYTIGVDGSGLGRLTIDSANNSQARWSPDGERIVFSSDRAGHLDLYLMNRDGSNQIRLTTTSGGGYYQSSFSPDGQWVVFQGRPDFRETRDRVFVVRSDGTGLRQLTDSSYSAEAPRWSSDGTAITFRRALYPRRLWADMGPDDMASANAGKRLMTMRADGSGLAELGDPGQRDPRPPWTRDVGFDGTPIPSPDARLFAYAKSVDGWSGIYMYDVAARRERLLTGGPGAGPLGYLRTATLTAGTDTLDTYESARVGPIRPGSGAYVVRTTRQVAGRRWEVSDTWFDSTGRATARQSVRTVSGSLATELETVRALRDSASMLVTSDRVTAWVVPPSQSPRLYDAPSTGERFTGTVVATAIAKARPAVGRVFVAPVGVLFGANPVETQVDSIRVVRLDTLYRDRAPISVLVLERAGGRQDWVEPTTGAIVLARGNAGPGRWWWHIRRGVRPPQS